ncbi:MAG: HD domain-containing protein [Candidatus Bipolaricaulota bacterium]|nr:MAG: HD domain-containing protein [Candidatus Bipolaricaulota bacterium]
MTLELLARHDSLEVTRQRIASGKLFYLDAASDWEGFELIYVLRGELRLKSDDEEIVLHAGDFVHHHGLDERALFHVEEEAELLLVASPPSFHLMRDEMQDLLAISRSVEDKDGATEEHCVRLERLALRTGERLALTGDDLIALSNAAYLHDVGKVELPDGILDKAGLLTDEERAEIKRHPEHGAKILEGRRELRSAAALVAAHHEWFNGEGYPNGLCGEEIPLGARIIAVVDAFDAMVTDRPYQPGVSVADAREELRRAAGTQFDPTVVEAFLGVLDDAP